MSGNVPESECCLQANEVLSGAKESGSKLDWNALSGDVRTLRENVEPALLNMTAQRFDQLKCAPPPHPPTEGAPLWTHHSAPVPLTENQTARCVGHTGLCPWKTRTICTALRRHIRLTEA